MKTEYKILKMMLEKRNDFTIRGIAKEIKADYRITYIAVQRLVDKDILRIRGVGKSSLCSLNKEYYGVEIYQVEEERKRNILRNKVISQIFKEIIGKINTGFFICLLFGSYVKGKTQKDSDIDLMFISNDVSFEDRINSILSLLPLEIHVLVFTEEEFRRMNNSMEKNVVKEIMENCIILFGVEGFYYLKNA